MKKYAILAFCVLAWSSATSQTPTIKNYLDWAYAKYEEAFDASDMAVAEIEKYSECTTESYQNSALVMAESGTDEILHLLKDAIFYLNEAEKIAAKKCSTSNSLFNTSIEHLENASYQYSKADKRLIGAIENNSKLLTKKEQIELVRLAIVGNSGGVDHLKKYVKAVNLNLQAMINCQ